MKKLFIISAVLLLSTMSTWAQTNALSFSINPETTGTFIIKYSTHNEPNEKVMEVDWGNGNIIVSNGVSGVFGGPRPDNTISGYATAGKEIKLYSNCIDAISIESPAKSILCESNNPQLQYIYYLHDNLTPEYLEILYQSLSDRTGKGNWGELHLSTIPYYRDANINIKKSNAFVTIDRNWRICSFKSFFGNQSERLQWSLNEDRVNYVLIPAITLTTSTKTEITDLQLGIMKTPENKFDVFQCNIRIDDGNVYAKSYLISTYNTNALFERDAQKLSVKAKYNTIKIYGSLISHIKLSSKQLKDIRIRDTNNLRYIKATNIDSLKYVNGLEFQTMLEELHLNWNLCLENFATLTNQTKLKIIDVEGCTALDGLYFNTTSLESLNISDCGNLGENYINNLSNATKLKTISASGLGWIACEMDAFYRKLSSTHPIGAKIWVYDVYQHGNENDVNGSNKTIATTKGWQVWEAGVSSDNQVTGNGGGCLTETPKLSFEIFPEASGTFKIYYSTINATTTNAVLVDWGDRVLKSYGEANSGDASPNKEIQGTATKGKPIKVYSNFLKGLYIRSSAHSILCGGNNPELAYFYYLEENLSSQALEHLYLSLTNRNDKGFGELHLSQSASGAAAGDNILKSNAFIVIDKNWYVCSFKGWSTDFSNRVKWFMNETFAKTSLIPAITLQTTTTNDITDLKLGIKSRPDFVYGIFASEVRIDDGTTNHKSRTVYQYDNNSNFINNAAKLTVKGTGTTSTIKIYGALVSHISTNQISALDISATTNLRGINITNCANLSSIPGLKDQTLLEDLNLDGNSGLIEVDVQNSPKLTHLGVSGCSNLSKLYYNTTSLEYLSFARCLNLVSYTNFGLATKLTEINAGNMGRSASRMNTLYGVLRSPAPTGAKIYVDDADLNGLNSNDWQCSDKTIATTKGWTVIRSSEVFDQYLTDDGSGCTMGINDVIPDKLITVFPNPATNMVTISIKQNLNAESLQVLDITGKTIYTMPISSSEFEYQINVSTYDKGIYLIRIGNITRKLFVK